MSLVSVIIPVYNGADFIGQAIQSVLRQTHQDFEIIVVDDGSTDNSPSEIASFQDARIVYVRQENAGLACARNTGLRIARGDYVALLDADDLYLPNKLESQLRAIASQVDVDLVAGGYRYTDQDGRPLSEVRPWQYHPILDLPTWLHGCPVIVNAVLVRRDWLERSRGFDPTLRRAEDWDLWLRLAYLGCRMKWTRAVVCTYRMHSQQMVRDGRSQKETTLHVLGNFFATPDLPPEILAQRQSAFAAAFLSGAFREYGARQVDDAQASFSRAIELEPSLMDGPVPPAADALVGWAVSPVTGDPAAYVQRVLDHLPPSAGKLRDLDQRLIYAAAIRSAVDAIEVDNIALARDYLKPLGQARYRPGNNPDLFITLAAEAVRGCEIDAQEVVLDQIFACLPDGAAAAWRRKTLGRVYMAHSFTCLGRGARREARRWAWQGVRQDPAWLKNRGVLSILGKPSILRTA